MGGTWLGWFDLLLARCGLFRLRRKWRGRVRSETRRDP